MLWVVNGKLAKALEETFIAENTGFTASYLKKKKTRAHLKLVCE